MEHHTVPTIYCINLKESIARRHRMDKRFTFHKLMSNVIYIDAISRDSNIIEYYHEDVTPQYPDLRKWRSEMACWASHLKAIRTFLETSAEEAIICEDDVILRNDFTTRYLEYRNNFPDDAPLVQLSYMVCKWEGYSWAGKDKDLNNLCVLNKEHTWGGQMYWISKSYAIECLKKYDKQFKELTCDHTCETMLRASNGYIVYPLLCIEECVDSEREPKDLPYHRNHFKIWGYDNFSDSEDNKLDPFVALCDFCEM